ncbi:thioredoxin domain-containing protein [Geoalkalibacter halelectricus]|uniref:thioredoxin domain-containing protein n=1 Tax=Geoalkalibacter halelectricus TaxID=2847045 RepID=UPI003D1CE073
MSANPGHQDQLTRLSQIDLAHLPADGGADFNRLIFEKSPYLLQHAENPLDWHSWGDEAFERARRENKPVFLSIGYSTCHWCHVMAHESFEDSEVAELLNQHFICIKVDREERPDIDNTYMTVCQMLTGSGGWPLTLLLTPERMPFFAATYLPKNSRGGMMGLLDLARKVAELWPDNRDRIDQTGEQIRTSLLRLEEAAGHGAALDEQPLRAARHAFLQSFDRHHAGFGQAPKFPTPHNLSLLLRIARRFDDQQARIMALQTLQQMRLGGIYDQIGFGLHRYSVDARWLVPHFEKMLYDQALAALAYLDAWQATGDAFFSQVAGEILDYLGRDLRHPEGAYCCGEDADTEGAEGTFYLWTPAQIREILGQEQGEIVCRIYGVSETGNFEGKNILYLEHDVVELARETHLSAEQLSELLGRARRQLLAARAKRIRPHRDDKVLTGWNGLAIAALARGGALLDAPALIAQAATAADFVLTRLRDANGRLLRRYRAGEAAIPAFLEDYSFLVYGLTELHQAGFDTRYLAEAANLNAEMLRLFQDDQGHLYDTGADAETVLTRGRTRHDGAVPAASSVAALNLLRLGRLCGKPELEEQGERLLSLLLTGVDQNPQAFSQLLIALDYALGPREEVVIYLPDDETRPEAMLAALRRDLRPRTLILLRRPGDREIEKVAAPVRDKYAVKGEVTAWVCRNQSCRPPVTSTEDLVETLSG